jgi:hypothetical protein
MMYLLTINIPSTFLSFAFFPRDDFRTEITILSTNFPHNYRLGALYIVE